MAIIEERTRALTKSLLQRSVSYIAMNNLYILSFLLIFFSCGNKNNTSINTPSEDSTFSKRKAEESEIDLARKHCEDNKHLHDTTYFPFHTDIIEDLSDGTRYTITVTSATGLCYFELFDRYRVYANGPGWQGVIEQIMEADLPGMKESIIYNSEADACVMDLPTLDEQQKAAKHLHDIFTNEEKLKGYLEKLDLSRIDA